MRSDSPISKPEWRSLYRRWAPYYDAGLWLYALVGYRMSRYRHRAIRGLALRPGDTVVDLGCGTGVNFAHLYEAVGPEGRIIGVDLTDAMLDQARARARRAGWKDVELVEADLAEYAFPADVDGVLSTFAVAVVPEYDDVIRRGAGALRSGGRMALCGMKRPGGWPEWLLRLGAWVQRPFGVRLEYAEHRPWASLQRYLHEVSYEEQYFGANYVSVGEKTDS
jgi:demethylmenaquinone methyltransferase/2-methoxy-6-polyprenyl-1,4-benzoquinol methylase